MNGAARSSLRRTIASLGWNGVNVVCHALLYAILYEALSHALNKPGLPSLESIRGAYTKSVLPILGIDLWPTMRRWIIVFLMGVIGGCVFGILAGWSERGYRVVELDLNLFRSLPATLLTTFIFTLLGDGDTTRMLPAAYITFFTVAFLLATATRNLDRRRVTHLEALGASRWFILRQCLIYEVAQPLFVAIRQAIALSFLVCISVELIVGSYRNNGLGRALVDLAQDFNYAGIIGLVATIGVIGYALNRAVLLIHRMITPWEEVR